MSPIPTFAIMSALTAVTDTGTSWIVSARLVAVTTTSSRAALLCDAKNSKVELATKYA